MSVVHVVDQVSQPAIVIATGTYSMSVAFVAVQVLLTVHVTVTETYSMNVAFVAEIATRVQTLIVQWCFLLYS
jgi:hypothetical protein